VPIRYRPWNFATHAVGVGIHESFNLLRLPVLRRYRHLNGPIHKATVASGALQKAPIWDRRTSQQALASVAEAAAELRVLGEFAAAKAKTACLGSTTAPKRIADAGAAWSPAAITIRLQPFATVAAKPKLRSQEAWTGST
jgi:hypothetical protein